jgi:hypothetical protein
MLNLNQRQYKKTVLYLDMSTCVQYLWHIYMEKYKCVPKAMIHRTAHT